MLPKLPSFFPMERENLICKEWSVNNETGRRFLFPEMVVGILFVTLVGLKMSLIGESLDFSFYFLNRRLRPH